MTRTEIAVRGAGPVGCAFALAVARAGRAVLLCAPAAPRPPAPWRPIALSYASRLILERLDAWAPLRATPIRTVHVSQARGFGRTRLEAADAGVPALGYVVDYAALSAALENLARARGIPIVSEAPRAALVVHAEGFAADAEEKAYGQEAVLARLACRPAAAHTAFERFTSEGPLALLPADGSYALVWAMRPARAEALAGAAPQAFLAALQTAVGARAGRFVDVSECSRVPLALRVRASRIGVREAFIGNSAQTLHPVAGQGLNLGLRDAWTLARLVAEADDPGDARLLARFAAARAFDARATIGATDFLAGAFLADDAASRAARGAALVALDACAPARRFFARRMIFGAYALP
ncbi:MAG: FAD-dependent monooxygenase [Burkholderiales bacterium]|nr:FAD-dependent monooxygenase [Burkholderiales bacterium]